MIEGENTERSHSGQSKVARDQQGSTEARRAAASRAARGQQSGAREGRRPAGLRAARRAAAGRRGQQGSAQQGGGQQGGVQAGQGDAQAGKSGAAASSVWLQGSLHKEIWLRRPPSFTGSFPAGTQWSLRRLVYGLHQAPREWHDTLRTTHAALGFAPSTADSSLFLRTDTTLTPFYVLVYADDLVFATADTEALAYVKTELQKRHTCTDLGPSALRLHVLLATVHSSAYRSLALSSTFSGHHRELRWLTYLLTDVGEPPRSPPVLYVDNKAMIALCQEHILEHRTKHIALRYFLARDLQQRGQLHLAYVATQANTTDVFTKALQPSCFAFLDRSCDLLFSPTVPMGEMVRKVFLTCGISNAEDGSQDHLILTHMRDSGEVEVLEDVMEELQDELVSNPFYPAPVVTPLDVTVEMEEEAVLAAEAEEADEEAVPAKSDSSESDDGNANEADEWSDEEDERWAPRRYEGAEVEEWVAGDEDE
ncbi:unnamed protein product [Closterium sp. NIES-53]